MVGCARGQDSKRQRAAGQLGRQAVDRAIPAGGDDKACAIFERSLYHRFHAGFVVPKVHFRLHVVLLHLGQDLHQLLRRFPRLAGSWIEDEFNPQGFLLSRSAHNAH